jgi:GT2 family glycosyltransferase
MNSPTVSVVMSVFNGEAFLHEAVTSILRQSYKDFEFIIMDDGSTDGSAGMLDDFRRCDSRIRVVHQPNSGLVQALNRGCGLANGKYIARMDADDVAMEERLKVQVEAMEMDLDIGVLGTAVVFIDASGEEVDIPRYHPTDSAEIERALLNGNAIWHPSVLIRTSILKLVGGYRNIPDAEDYDLWLRVADHAQLKNLPMPLLKYRIHPGQGSVTRCRKQVFGALASQASASARRSGRPDPLTTIDDLTPETLLKMGIGKVSLDTTLARAYLACIRNMRQSGESAFAARMFATIDSAEFRFAERWVVADSHLLAAQMHWSGHRRIKALGYLIRALITRPVIAGRPLKIYMNRLRA